MLWWPRTAFREFIQQGGAQGLIPSVFNSIWRTRRFRHHPSCRGGWVMAQQACNISHAPAVLLVRRELVHLLQTQSKSLGLVYWAFDPGTLCFQGKCRTGCLSREMLRYKLGRRSRGIKASLISTTALCNAQWSTFCPVSQLPQEPVGKPTKNLCALRGLCSPV